MEDQKHPHKISQLLEKLQEESWQLELLISGFAIFLVASSFEHIEKLMLKVNVLALGYADDDLIKIPVLIMIAAWLFMLTNLIIHVILRGFWIAAIGLRYVSGDVNFETLRLAPKFDRFLKRRIPSFDNFIERLEKICSVVFAFTFLIIFMFISVGMFLAFIGILGSILDLILPKLIAQDLVNNVKILISFLFLIAGFIYFIDFLTLSWIKRIKWFSRIYYPIYRFFSLLTLSFLYRPLYYNLIDEKFGRRVGLLIFPYVILLFTLVSMRVDAFKYFPSSDSDHEIIHAHYLDIIGEKEMVDEISIPSKIIKSDFLELFIPYLERYDDEIELLCPGIKPDKNMGIKFDIVQLSGDIKPSPTDSLITCVSQLHQLYINDSLYTSPIFHFYKHPRNDEHGLLSLVDIHHLERGQHKLQVFTARKLRNTSIGDSIAYLKNVAFPFWKE